MTRGGSCQAVLTELRANDATRGLSSPLALSAAAFDFLKCSFTRGLRPCDDQRTHFCGRQRSWRQREQQAAFRPEDVPAVLRPAQNATEFRICSCRSAASVRCDLLCALRRICRDHAYRVAQLSDACSRYPEADAAPAGRWHCVPRWMLTQTVLTQEIFRLLRNCRQLRKPGLVSPEFPQHRSVPSRALRRVRRLRPETQWPQTDQVADLCRCHAPGRSVPDCNAVTPLSSRLHRRTATGSGAAGWHRRTTSRDIGRGCQRLSASADPDPAAVATLTSCAEVSAADVLCPACCGFTSLNRRSAPTGWCSVQCGYVCSARTCRAQVFDLHFRRRIPEHCCSAADWSSRSA